MSLLKHGTSRVSLARNAQFFRSIAQSDTRTIIASHLNSKRFAVIPGQRCRIFFSSLPSKEDDEKKNVENRISIPPENTITTPIDFAVSSKIEGEESQIATIQLRPGEKLRAESGAMLFMTQGIEMATNLEGASSAFRRMMTGQNVFLTDFTYTGTKDGEGSGTVALGTDFPSKILRLSLDDYGGSLIAQRGAYLASNASVDIQMEFTRTMTAGFFGGQGFILQRLEGEGDVLLKAGGTLVERDLKEGEVLRATSGSIVAFEPSVSYDIQMMQGVKNVMFGGEGLFVTTLTGPGRVWLQGMPQDRMVSEIASRIPSGGGLGPVIPVGVGGGGAEGAPPIEGDTPVGGEEAAGIEEGINADPDPDPMSPVQSSDTMDGDSSSYSNTVGEGNDFQETTFTDDEVDFIEPNFDDDTSFNTMDSNEGFDEGGGDFFEDDSTEFFDSGNFDAGSTEDVSDAAEAGSNILSTLWDIFTGGD